MHISCFSGHSEAGFVLLGALVGLVFLCLNAGNLVRLNKEKRLLNQQFNLRLSQDSLFKEGSIHECKSK
jgi:hypothetical protein